MTIPVKLFRAALKGTGVLPPYARPGERLLTENLRLLLPFRIADEFVDGLVNLLVAW